MSASRTRINRNIAVAAAAALVVAGGIAVQASASPSTSRPSAAPATKKSNVVLEKDAQAFADASAKGAPIYTLSYADARKALEDAQAGPVDKLPADISHRTLKVGPTGEVKIRIVRPAGVSGKLPVVMYFHGGGWVLGSEDTHDRLVRQIADKAKAAVIFVDYTPSPRPATPSPSSRRTRPPSGSPSTATRSTSTVHAWPWPVTASAAT